MDYEYSKSMKKLMKKQPSIIMQIIFISIMALLVWGSIYGYRAEKKNTEYVRENTGVFDHLIQIPVYSEITPLSLSEEFAANYNDSIYYYFAFDDELNTYIMAISPEEIDKYQDLIDFTYSDAAEVPNTVTLQGMPVKMNDEMIAMTIDAYNTFWGSDIVNEDNYVNYIGAYYLDTTQGPAEDFGILSFCLFLIVALGIAYIFFLTYTKKLSRRRQATMGRCSNEMLWNVDQDINHPTTVCFSQQKLYFTRNYIVSNVSGFDIIPLEEILHVYGSIYSRRKKNTKKSIVVETRDGMKHEIATVSIGSNGEVVYNQIMELMKQHMPDIKYGFENDFYTMITPNLNVDVNDAMVDGKNNIFLGILGAILGAALGGVIWIILGEIGIIAGLAGYAMIYFAIKGYRKLSGFLDKRGQIISILIALIMVFIANYTLYALEYCKYNFSSYNMVNIVNSFKQLPNYLTWAEAWGDFLKDLIIGYALSIWAGFGVIKSTFFR